MESAKILNHALTIHSKTCLLVSEVFMERNSLPHIKVNPQEENVQRHATELGLFRKALGLEPKFAYYPACNTDVSPSIAFPKSEVIYLDTNVLAARAIRQVGYRAVCCNLEEYIPRPPPDLAIMMMSGRPEKVLQHIAVGGHFICDNIYHTASDAFAFANYSLVAVLLYDAQIQRAHVSTESLIDYRTVVQTDEELIAADSEGIYRNFYLRHAGATNRFLAAQASLAAIAIQRTKTSNAASRAVQPWLTQDSELTDRDPIYLEPAQLREEVLPLPYRKRATLYAFRRDE